MTRPVIVIPSVEEAAVLSTELEKRGMCRAASAPDLIRLLLCQAVSDGMSKMTVGVDASTGQSYMKYGRRSPTGRFESWEMVAPPVEFFPLLLQYLLSVTELEPIMPSHGKVLAADGEKRLELHVELTVPNAFEITWDQAEEGFTTEARSSRKRNAELE